MIREIRESDLSELKEIHNRFYKKEFLFPNFKDHFICAYVVEKNGKIITAGGIRTIVECVAVTNKDLSVRERIEGLTYLLNASKYFTERNGYSELHAFVKDPNWEDILVKKGFSKTEGQSLVLEI